MSNDPNKPDQAEGAVPSAEPSGADAPTPPSPEVPPAPAPDTPAEAAAHPVTPPPVAPEPEQSSSPYLLAPGQEARDEEEDEPRKEGAGGGTLKKVLIAVLAVVVVGVGVFAVRYFTSGTSAQAGDCVSVAEKSGETTVDVDTLGCGEDKATYKVGKVLQSSDATCPEEGLYSEVTPASSAGDGYKLCLLPNMTEGACYKPSDTGSDFVKTACSGAETIKVTKVLQGDTDTSKCPEGAGMSYPEPAVTYCLAPAEQ
ncbi:hypothetical protein [Actinosynnema sp. NPDC020468]|uniref:LppU/SCO3897 family protein n=1 Tax=Actinosynnema sp. NPDC020468 TaxID=3154488 RepID=UPI0033EE63ED